MKKKIIALLSLIAVMLCSLCACFGDVSDDGQVTVVIEGRDGSYKEYTVLLSDVENKNEGAAGVIEHLASRSDDPLDVDMQNGSYGMYINSIGGLVPDTSSGEYVSVYTSVEADFGTYADVGEITYGQTLLKSSGVGISSMQITDGTVILFRIEVSSW